MGPGIQDNGIGGCLHEEQDEESIEGMDRRKLQWIFRWFVYWNGECACCGADAFARATV